MITRGDLFRAWAYGWITACAVLKLIGLLFP